MIFLSKLTFLISLLIIFSSFALFSEDLRSGKDKVAQVNRKVITTKELETEYAKSVKMGVPNPDGSPLTKMNILERMIDRELLVAEVNAKKVILTDDQTKQIDSILQQNINSFIQQRKSQNSNYKYSDADFDNYLQNSESITLSKFKENIESGFKIQKYIEQKSGKRLMDLEQKQFTDSEKVNIQIPNQISFTGNVQDFFNKIGDQFIVPKSVEIKHIFRFTVGQDRKPVSDETKKDVKKKMDEILTRLKTGESFDSLCELYTEDIESKNAKNPLTGQLERGYLGPLTLNNDQARQQFGDQIVNILINMKKGQFSDVLESSVGYHIFYAMSNSDRYFMEYDKPYPILQGLTPKQHIIEKMFKPYFKSKIVENEYNSSIKELRKNASIEYFNEYKKK